MESTTYLDIQGNEIMSNSLVIYTDVVHGVENEAGYIVKNLLNQWEVRNVSEQTGNSLADVTNVKIIGTSN